MLVSKFRISRSLPMTAERRPKEAPLPMLIAMGVAAILSVGIGIHPEPLYALLPDQAQIAGYHPYSAYHIIEQLQLLLWAILAFAVLILIKWYPAEVPSTNLDTDWFYRVPGRAACDLGGWRYACNMECAVGEFSRIASMFLMARIYAVHGPEGQLARNWPIGFMALWTAVLLGLVLVLSFLA